MICPTCKSNLLKKLKRNELYNCRCGAKLLAVEINKKLEIFNLSKGE